MAIQTTGLYGRGASAAVLVALFVLVIWFFPASPFARYLSSDRSLYRVAAFPPQSLLWRPNQGMVHGIDCFDGRIKGVDIHRLNGNLALSADLKSKMD